VSNGSAKAIQLFALHLHLFLNQGSRGLTLALLNLANEEFDYGIRLFMVVATASARKRVSICCTSRGLTTWVGGCHS
jgi:hypothetical protein